MLSRTYRILCTVEAESPMALKDDEIEEIRKQEQGRSGPAKRAPAERARETPIPCERIRTRYEI